MGITKGDFLERGRLALLGDVRDCLELFHDVGTDIRIPLESVGGDVIGYFPWEA